MKGKQSPDEKIDKSSGTDYSWMKNVPPSDNNFKSVLGKADAPTIREVLADMPPVGEITRRRALESRLRKLEKATPPVKLPPEKLTIEFADEGDVFSENRLYNLPISLIEPSPFASQAERRKRFVEEKLLELGESIILNGLIEPITVRERRQTDGTRYFEIVCGERRWLASRRKDLPSINCFIRELTDSQTLVMQYEENHQQQANAPLDDALTFKLLHEKENLSEQEIADRTGTTRRNVVDKLKLNDLIPEARSELESGSLLLKHAYYLAKFPAATQSEIVGKKFAYKYNDSAEKPVSFDEFKAEVEENILRRLKNAPFNIGDPRLHIKNLICVECPEQTGRQNYLFPDHAGNDARCLNPGCFRLKTDTHLKLQREAIAAKLPNPENKPFEEMVKSVPLVTSESYAPARHPFAEKITTSVEVLPEPECAFSEESVAVGGAEKGERVWECKNDDCPIHHPKPAAPSPEEINRREKHFNSEVDKSVRRQIMTVAADWFDDYKSFWQFDDLIKNLIYRFLSVTQFTQGADFLFFIKDWEGAPNAFNFPQKLREFVDGLDKRRQSQLLFLMANLSEFPTSRAGNTDENVIRAIAKNYAKLDYDALTEEIRENLKNEI